MAKRKPQSLIKYNKHNHTVNKVMSIAKDVVSKLALTDLTARVSEAAGIKEEEAINLLNNGLEQEIHSLLAEKLTEGVFAIKALEALNKKVEEGNMEAIKLVVSFSPKLKPNNVRVAESLTINQTNVFAELDKNAKKLLGEDVIDVDYKETE